MKPLFVPLKQRFTLESFKRGWYRFKRNPTSLVGFAIVTSILLLAILAPWVVPYPEHVKPFVDFANANQPPTWRHPFGTDSVGRDIFTRTIYGYRISLTLVAVVLSIAVPVGVVLGLVAGYFGGWIETIIMRSTDIFLSLPPLLMALAITAALTPNIFNAIIAISAVWWTWHARLVHSIVSSLRNEDFVEASSVIGAGTFHTLFKEILPNCVSAIIVKITLDAGYVILIGAGLSFLGLGVQPPKPGLGTMVAKGTEYLPDLWWEPVFPGLAILIAILGFNLLGDGLRDFFDVEEV